MSATEQERAGAVQRDALGRVVKGSPSLNPGGRPRQKPLTDALTRKLERMGDDGLDAFMDGLFSQVANGDKAAAGILKQLWDRREGPVVQQLEALHDMRSYVVVEGEEGDDATPPPMPEDVLGLNDDDDLEEDDDDEPDA